MKELIEKLRKYAQNLRPDAGPGGTGLSAGTSGAGMTPSAPKPALMSAQAPTSVPTMGKQGASLTAAALKPTEPMQPQAMKMGPPQMKQNLGGLPNPVSTRSPE